MKEVRVAMIGFGGIAKSHKKGYEILAAEGANVRLVAICDIDPGRFTAGTVTNLGAEKAANLDGINTYTNVDEMLEKEDFSMVDICIPTYLHCEYAIKMMKAGKHVLSEKPMALNSADCEKMLAAAKEYNRVLMIGQCLRFEPAYLYLKKCVDEGTFGKLKNMRMHRMSSHPMWGFEQWYTKTEKSGGCIMDLHIHDVDFVLSLFGQPKSLHSVRNVLGEKNAYVNTLMQYEDHVVGVEGTWDLPASHPFQATFRVVFEKAVVENADGKFMLYTAQGAQPIAIEKKELSAVGGTGGNISDLGGYYNELLYFTDCAASGKPICQATLSQASESLTFLLEKELV